MRNNRFRLPWPLANVEWGAALRGAFVNRSVRRHYELSLPGLRGVLHTNRQLRQGYLALTRTIAGDRTYDFAKAGVIPANSIWSKELLRERYGIETEVVYPPVMMRVMGVSPER